MTINKQHFSCGRCIACLNNKRTDWTNRITQELKISTSANFITLTYADEYTPQIQGLPSLSKTDLQKFFKRLRKKTPNKIRYFAVGEYGTRTYRPHYHIILFNLSPKERQALDLVNQSWGLGMVHIGTVNAASIHYCTKYIMDKKLTPYEHNNKTAQKCFTTQSRNPGLGANYFETNTEWHQRNYRKHTYIPLPDGKKTRLPRYYKTKIFNKYQMEQQKGDYNKPNPRVSFDQWYRRQRDNATNVHRKTEKAITENKNSTDKF